MHISIYVIYIYSERSEDIVKYLNRLYLKSNLRENGLIDVEVGPTRHDVMHPVDIFEDIAIAYGYNHIPKSPPGIMQVASQTPLNVLTRHLREQLAQAGFTETLTFTLVSYHVVWCDNAMCLIHLCFY